MLEPDFMRPFWLCGDMISYDIRRADYRPYVPPSSPESCGGFAQDTAVSPIES